ncbi:MAG: N-acetylmuramoyl-L-alanine amidase [Myxococcota bacterium]|nr:N-acetylmuramoyl-L-alanine amidase [Myxococcota bacterium]
MSRRALARVGSRRIATLAALLAFATLAMGAKRPPGLGDVSDVRTWSYPTFTRVVVETTRASRGALRHLAANPAAGRGERLYVDLPGIWVGAGVDPIRVRDGLLDGVRLGQNTPRTTRLVVDLSRYSRHRLFFLSAPHRLVLDVYGPRDGKAGRPPPAVSPPGRKPSPRRSVPVPSMSVGRLPLELRPVQKVVIDPGHGGKDPGAVGLNGLREKDVNLVVAKDLAERLRARGFDTFLTRTGDETLSLEERTARAEGAQGDVFVSIHANAARRRGAHGIETYFLDANHERHALRVAARENGIAPSALDDLQRTLADLRVGEVGSYSQALARAVHPELIRGVKASHGSVRDLGVKRGPFYVLFLSSMPSILVETGFVTNRSDARRLGSRFYRNVLAEHIARGLSRYRSERALQLARDS